MNGLELKKEFTRNVFSTVEKTFMHPNREVGLRYFTKKNPHFFERIIERGINQYDVETMFFELISTNHEKILDICKRDANKMNSTDSVCIYVKKGDLAIVLILFDDRKGDNCFSMMPLTILANHEYQKCDYEINL